MSERVCIAVVGDYNPGFHSHPATTEAIHRAAQALRIEAEVQWVPTDSITPANVAGQLSAFDAVWAAPGSPYRSMEGAFAAIRFAREQNWPFTGT